MIRKEGDKYVVKSEDGSRKLGSYPSKEKAKKRLRQVEYFKNLEDYIKKANTKT